MPQELKDLPPGGRTAIAARAELTSQKARDDFDRARKAFEHWQHSRGTLVKGHPFAWEQNANGQRERIYHGTELELQAAKEALDRNLFNKLSSTKKIAAVAREDDKPHKNWFVVPADDWSDLGFEQFQRSRLLWSDTRCRLRLKHKGPVYRVFFFAMSEIDELISPDDDGSDQDRKRKAVTVGLQRSLAKLIADGKHLTWNTMTDAQRDIRNDYDQKGNDKNALRMVDSVLRGDIVKILKARERSSSGEMTAEKSRK